MNFILDLYVGASHVFRKNSCGIRKAKLRQLDYDPIIAVRFIDEEGRHSYTRYKTLGA